MRVEFIEAPAFTRHLASYLDDSGYLALQLFLTDSPDAGDVIPGAGATAELAARRVAKPRQRRR